MSEQQLATCRPSPGDSAESVVGGRFRQGRHDRHAGLRGTSPRPSTSAPTDRVLDVACGSGNAAIAAARRTWGEVIGLDFVPAPARACPRAGRRRAAWISSSSRATPQDLPLRGRQLRRRCSRSSARCSPPTRSRPPPSCWASPPRGPDRDGQLDPRGVRRRDVHDHREARPAAAGPDAAGRLGHRGSVARAVRRRDLGPALRAANLSTRRFLSADQYIAFFKELVRADQDGVRAGRRGRARRRSRRTTRSMDRRHDTGGDRDDRPGPSTWRWSRPEPRA